MPTHRRVKSKDEEFGKRDEDGLRSRAGSGLPDHAFKPWRWRKRRLVAVLAGVVVILFFLIRNFPTDLDAKFTTTSRSTQGFPSAQEVKEPVGPPRTEIVVDTEQGKHYYEGKIRFYKLASSLHGISKTMGMRPTNRNILFAASSLKSLANLIPLACRMGKWDRNYVHVAILGRDPLPLQDILEINSVDKDQCYIYFHDGRSDYSEYSTDKRAEVSVLGAMHHINGFMHPQAIITDDSAVEDQFFSRAMKKKAKEIKRPLIEIPHRKYDDFTWMTKLDSGSLASWHEPTIDILIHAPPQSSGGLIRLVKSLQEADYSGLKLPRLTIELPSDVEPFAKRYLEELNWPPPDKKSLVVKPSTLQLRHRIPNSRLTSEEASLRFLESFYPTKTETSHVLVLSPHVELHSSFFQYLFYVILEYRHSAYEVPDLDDMLGISLDVPTTLLDGSTRLDTPRVKDMSSKRYTEDTQLDQFSSTPWLYGAPTSTASLIFGDKWATFHNFLARRIASNHQDIADKPTKVVSAAEPAWMEYLLELMRSRGLYMLHPASPAVVVHNDLSRIPEEYLRPTKSILQHNEEPMPSEEPTADEPFMTVPGSLVLPMRMETYEKDIVGPLHEMLPFDGDLPEIANLPYMDHTGVKGNVKSPQMSRIDYAAHFRKSIGGCTKEQADRPRLVAPLSADWLFCLPGMDIDFADEVVSDDVKEAAAIVEETKSENSGSQSEPAGKERSDDGKTVEASEDKGEESSEKQEPEI